MDKDHDDYPTMLVEIVPLKIFWISIYQIDTLLIENSNVSSLRYSIKDQMGFESFGLRMSNRGLSALYAEMKMTVSCMRDKRVPLVWFQMDCSDLVDMTTRSIDWLFFALDIGVFRSLHDDFESMSMYFLEKRLI